MQVSALLTPNDLQYYTDLYNQALHTTTNSTHASTNTINGLTVRNLFLHSKLTKQQLQEVWILSDRQKRKSLDREHFFLALRLVSIAQQNLPLTYDSVQQYQQLPLPYFEGIAQPRSNSYEASHSRQPSQSASNNNGSLPLPTFPATATRSVPQSRNITPDLHASERGQQRLAEATPLAAKSLFGDNTNGNSNRLSISTSLPSSPNFVEGPLSNTSQASGSNQPFSSVSSNGSSDNTPNSSASATSHHHQRSVSTADSMWAMTPTERDKYEQLFPQADKDKNGYVGGNEAAQFFRQSGLDNVSLRKIWLMADIDRDNALSLDEFCIAMHLVLKARKKLPLPSSLPDLLDPRRQKQSVQYQQPSPMSAPTQPSRSAQPSPQLPATSASPPPQQQQPQRLSLPQSRTVDSDFFAASTSKQSPPSDLDRQLSNVSSVAAPLDPASAIARRISASPSVGSLADDEMSVRSVSDASKSREQPPASLNQVTDLFSFASMQPSSAATRTESNPPSVPGGVNTNHGLPPRSSPISSPLQQPYTSAPQPINSIRSTTPQPNPASTNSNLLNLYSTSSATLPPRSISSASQQSQQPSRTAELYREHSQQAQARTTELTNSVAQASQQYDNTQQEIQQLQQKLAQFDEQHNELEEQLHTKQQQLSELQHQQDELHVSVNEQQQRLDTIQSNIRSIQTVIEQKQQDIHLLQQKLQQLETAVSTAKKQSDDVEYNQSIVEQQYTQLQQQLQSIEQRQHTEDTIQTERQQRQTKLQREYKELQEQYEIAKKKIDSTRQGSTLLKQSITHQSETNEDLKLQVADLQVIVDEVEKERQLLQQQYQQAQREAQLEQQRIQELKERRRQQPAVAQSPPVASNHSSNNVYPTSAKYSYRIASPTAVNTELPQASPPALPVQPVQSPPSDIHSPSTAEPASTPQSYAGSIKDAMTSIAVAIKDTIAPSSNNHEQQSPFGASTDDVQSRSARHSTDSDNAFNVDDAEFPQITNGTAARQPAAALPAMSADSNPFDADDLQWDELDDANTTTQLDDPFGNEPSAQHSFTPPHQQTSQATTAAHTRQPSANDPFGATSAQPLHVDHDNGFDEDPFSAPASTSHSTQPLHVDASFESELHDASSDPFSSTASPSKIVTANSNTRQSTKRGSVNPFEAPEQQKATNGSMEVKQPADDWANFS